MGELFFVSEDPTTKTSAYATRINQQEWQKHKAEIKRLHDNGATRRDIITAITTNDFRPSFGQLVAQMTRWRFMRYSKLDQHIKPASQCAAVSQDVRTGILQMVAVLVGQAESAKVNAHCSDSDSDKYNTSNSMSVLLQSLSLREPKSSGVENDLELGKTPDADLFGYRNDLADFCFLGGSYDKAYQKYSSIATALICIEVQRRDEIILVQAISGCLRSASTNTEWQYAHRLAKWYTNPSESLPPIKVARDADQYHPRTYAEFARLTLDLLNHLDRTFSPLSAANPAKVNKVISRHWLALRLNRLPTWSSVLSDTTHTPLPEIDNLPAALQWAHHAITTFAPLFDEQISKLWPTARTSLETWTQLLFWRLLFANRQSDPNLDQETCPVLRIRLSAATSCELSAQETLAVIARLITGCLDEVPAPIRAHGAILWAVGEVLERCDEGCIMPRLWAVLHVTLHPTLLYDELNLI